MRKQGRPGRRALRTERATALALLGQFNVMEHMANLSELYFGGDMEAAIPLSGEVAGRIESVKSVQEIIDETVSEFRDIMQELAGRYVA